MNLPISQKKACGRLEFAISPEYLSMKMNYCLLLSNSIVNMLLFPGKNSIVNHAGSCSTGTAYQAKQSEADTAPGPLGLILALFLDQNRRKAQVMSLCWLLLTHRAMAVARAAQCREKQGHPTHQNPSFGLASPQSFLKPMMATNPRHGREYLSCSKLQALSHSKRLISDTI